MSGRMHILLEYREYRINYIQETFFKSFIQPWNPKIRLRKVQVASYRVGQGPVDRSGGLGRNGV